MVRSPGSVPTLLQVGEVALEIGADARVGPYAHLAPGASVPSSMSTGAFYTSPAD